MWAPGLAVFIIVISGYLVGLFPNLASLDFRTLNLVVGSLVLESLTVRASENVNGSPWA